MAASSSRYFGSSILLSFKIARALASFDRGSISGRRTAAATTGPARQPLPTSSKPIIASGNSSGILRSNSSSFFNREGGPLRFLPFGFGFSAFVFSVAIATPAVNQVSVAQNALREHRLKTL